MEEIYTIGTNRRKSSTDIWHIRFDLPAATTAEKLGGASHVVDTNPRFSPSVPFPSPIIALLMLHTFPSLLFFSP